MYINGHVNEKVYTNVMKTSIYCLLSVMFVHLTEVFHLGPFLLSTTVPLNG